MLSQSPFLTKSYILLCDIIFYANFLFAIFVMLSPKTSWILLFVIESSLHFVLAINVQERIEFYCESALVPKLSPAFKSIFFYKIVTIPSCTT